MLANLSGQKKPLREKPESKKKNQDKKKFSPWPQTSGWPEVKIYGTVAQTFFLRRPPKVILADG